jgi:hypothetical protein
MAENQEIEGQNEVPALSSIKPRSKPILSDSEVVSFESCIKSDFVGCRELTKVTEGAYYIDNVLTEEECENLRNEIDGSNSLTFWCFEKEEDESVRAFRNAKTIEIQSYPFCTKIWERIKDLFDSFHVQISSDPDDPDYERDLIGSWLPISLNPCSLFARYPSLGSFAPHTDGRAIIDFNTRSHYSVVLFLNSVPKAEGAGTRFYSSEAVKQLQKDSENRWTADTSLLLAEVEAVEGRFLFFHQSLVHEGVPPATPFLKYIIRSDIIFERTPKICDSPQDREAYQLFRKAEEVAENGEVELSLQLFKKAFRMSPRLAQIMGHC